MTAGQEFVKWLKPFGCVLFIVIFVLFLVMCFSAKAPLEGYSIPHDSEYYAEHLDELEQELETNMFPQLEGIEDCRIDGDKLTIVIDSEHFEETSEIITHYYGQDLFNLQND